VSAKSKVLCGLLLLAILAPAPTFAAQPDSDAARSPAAYLRLIGELRASGRPRACLAHLDAFELKTPRDPQAKLLRGDCLVDVGQYDAAEAVYRPLLKGPQAAAAAAGLGRTAALRGDWPAAADNFAEAVRRAPINAAYIGDLGFALLRAGRANDAVFRLRQAAELSPDASNIRNNLILALEASGDEAAAAKLLTQVTDPQDLKALTAMRAELKGSGSAGG
jgi:Flp pilus assembly protein TadD